MDAFAAHDAPAIDSRDVRLTLRSGAGPFATDPAPVRMPA
jgi:hypothetical protein